MSARGAVSIMRLEEEREREARGSRAGPVPRVSSSWLPSPNFGYTKVVRGGDEVFCLRATAAQSIVLARAWGRAHGLQQSLSAEHSAALLASVAPMPGPSAGIEGPVPSGWGSLFAPIPTFARRGGESPWVGGLRWHDGKWREGFRGVTTRSLIGRPVPGVRV